MGIEDIQISEELETNAPSIKYRGNEGPKSPQEEQMMMLIQKLMSQGMGQEEAMQMAQQMMAEAEQQQMPQQQMPPRQMAAFGGIMGLDGRRQYGLGSSLKKRLRKLIPNEVAKVAEVAAPFVAPFNPLAAGLMSGIGGFDRTGKIGSSIKSGLMNYGMGQGARYLGGADFQTGFDPRGGMSGMKYGFSKPTGSGGIKDLFADKSGPKYTGMDKIGSGSDSLTSLATAPGEGALTLEQMTNFNKIPVENLGETGGILNKIKAFALDNKLLTGLAAGTLGMTALMGNMEEDEIQDMQRGEGLDIEGIRTEVIEAMKDPSGEKLKAIRIKYPFLGTQRSKNQAAMAMGGRAGYAEGKKVDYEEDPLYINQDYDEMTVPLTEYEKALREMTKRERQEEFEMLKKVLKQRGNIGRDLGIAGGGQTGMERQMELLNFGTNTPDKDTGYKDNYSMKQRAAEYLDRPYFNEQYETGEHYAMGGRIRRAEGGLMDLGGMEKDYRAEGGFVPIGEYEKKDDVPARLSVNEFVFTADAVRGAGQGDIDKGAEIMENVMKNLEQGGQLSEESQGMQGARDMFQTSQRLGEVI
jgi:hypothetical protein